MTQRSSFFSRSVTNVNDLGGLFPMALRPLLFGFTPDSHVLHTSVEQTLAKRVCMSCRRYTDVNTLTCVLHRLGWANEFRSPYKRARVLLAVPRTSVHMHNAPCVYAYNRVRLLSVSVCDKKQEALLRESWEGMAEIYGRVPGGNRVKCNQES